MTGNDGQPLHHPLRDAALHVFARADALPGAAHRAAEWFDIEQLRVDERAAVPPRRLEPDAPDIGRTGGTRPDHPRR